MTFSLSDGARRLSALLDATQNKGSASLQVGGVTCGITDRDIRNNASPCALTGGS
jgi:hypothetical protein